MTRNHNDDDASSGITIKTCDNGGGVPWSDLNHDVLLLVIMKIRVVDFLAFGGVCKSWRSLAVSNRKEYMASKAPMAIRISNNANKNEFRLKDFEGIRFKITLPHSISIITNVNEKECRLEDFEGKKFKTTLLHSANRTCVGLTCGYLILFSKKTRDFWLVNPITRHELHFPDIVCDDNHVLENFRAILVFSPSKSEWVFVMVHATSNTMWFSVAGKRKWTYVSTRFRIINLQAFKGKIYALHSCDSLSEVRLYPTPKVTLLEFKNISKADFDHPVLVSLGENLYVMDLFSKIAYKFINSSKLEKIEEDEFLLFFSKSKQGVPVISDLPSQYKRYAVTHKDPKRRIFYAKMWYSFHDCLNVNILHE